MSDADWGECVEQHLGVLIVDGQRCDVSIRTDPGPNGTWHNALVFKRDGRVTGSEVLVTGVDWHVSPEDAFARASALGDKEHIELLRRALRPRPPIA